MKTVFRKFLLLGVSVAVIVVTAMIYSRFAGSNHGTVNSMDEKPRPRAIDNSESIKRVGRRGTSLDRGEKIDSYDLGVGGRIESEYHIKLLFLQTEDQARLEGITFIWYLKDGRTLKLTAQSGQVYIDHGSYGDYRPTHGVLTGNVRIEYDTRPQKRRTGQALDQDDAERLIITTDSLNFDTRSFTLSTNKAVQLRGAGLDGQGTGLLLRWRQISRTIDTLTILHGGQLTWLTGRGRGFATVMAPEEPTAKTTTTATAPETPTPKPTTTTIVTQTPTPKQQPVTKDGGTYLASFHDNVRVSYKDQVLSNVNILNVTFEMRSRDETDTTAQTAQPSLDTNADTNVDTDTAKPDSPASAQDEPQDTEELLDSLLITWTGKLQIVPSQTPKEYSQPSTQKRFEVEAIGNPVKFSSRDMSGSCARLHGKHHSGILHLFGSSDFDVHLQTADGNTVVCDELHIRSIDANTSIVQMIGKGSLKSIDQATDKPSKRSRILDLTWNGGVELKFHKLQQPTDTTSQDYYLSHATARKQVVVVSDQLNAWADKMQIKLGPPGSDGTKHGQAILLLNAQDNFKAKLTGQHLTLMADSMKTSFTRRRGGEGEFVSSILLEDNIKVVQQQPGGNRKNELECEEMLISLAEDTVTNGKQSTYGGSRISNLLAKRNVIGRYIVNGKTHSKFSAYKLERDESAKTTVLSGNLAKLERGDDRLESKVIRIVDKGDDYILSTPGPGKMRARFASAEDGSEPAILGLDWPGRMEFDGTTNRAVFQSTADELVTGAWLHSLRRHSKLEGEKLELFLRDDQSAQSDNNRSPSQASKDLISSEPFFKPMGGRSLEKMILTGQAKVRAVEEAPGPSKKRLRSVLLTSDILTYQIDKEAGSFHGEGAGTLLLEDNRPTDKVVSDARPSTALKLHRVGPGQTGFWWTDSADFNQAKRTVLLLGDVHMVSRGYALTLPAKRSELATATKRRHITQLWSEKFKLTLSQAKSDAGRQKSSNFANLSAMDELEIESVEASGNAKLSSSDVEAHGDKIAYNTKTEIVLIESRRRKAGLSYMDPKRGWGTWTGKSIRFNTRTHEGHAPGGRFEVFRDR